MESGNGKRPPQQEARRFRFGDHILDLDRGSLARDGNEVALRPKNFAVLQHLVVNSQRLVPKDELFSVVWPDVAVTDDVLVQTVGELRRALGNDGPRLITTVPRRGYRFEAAVVAEALVPLDREGGDVMPARSGRRTWLTIGALVGLLGVGVAWTNRSKQPADRQAPIPDATARPVVAILPLSGQSEDGPGTHLADGVTQDLIAALGRFSALTVMSWNAVAPWRGQSANPRDVSARLGVRYQVEGSVRLAAGRAGINAQLVDAEGRVLWSRRYEVPIADLFALGNSVANEIAGALAIRVTQAELQRVNAKPTESLEAYDLVLRARPALQNPTRAGLAEARSLLRRAVQADPQYPAAYAALAEADYIAVSWGWAEAPSETLARAEAMAGRALRMNESELRARVVLGRIQLAQDRYEQARAEMERAVLMNPSDAHGLGGLGNALMWLGQPDAAIQSLERALRIDPDLNAIDRFALAMAYYLAHRYDAAIDQGLANIRASAGSVFNHVLLAAAYQQANRLRDAEQSVAAIRRVYPSFDAAEFGNKLQRPEDIEHIRDGLRRAGL